MSYRKFLRARLAPPLLIAGGLLMAGCQSNSPRPGGSGAPTALRQVPAVRLNFRYEADVPGPAGDGQKPAGEERNAAVQADFDQNRPQEILDKTLTSPDKKRVLAVYHKVNDTAAEFRLDMYLPDGKLLKKITPETMAVHFPDTILWSPDSSSVAFVAMTRAVQNVGNSAPQSPSITIDAPTPPDINSNNTQDDTNANSAVPATTPVAPAGVLTFRTEQIYICNSDGDGLKPLTQSEGKIYFYFAWSPDSTMLAALVATSPEWRFLFDTAEKNGEIFVPLGRPRIVEKSGRERLLDDALTKVQPVWSPDSSKVAAAFDTQVRIYDAISINPTQAAIPLKNQLLISSQAYDVDLQKRAEAENSAINTNSNAAAANSAQSLTTLPDPATLVSFSPIINLEWTSDDILYLQTGYVKEYKNPADNRRSYLRWHRLILSPQAGTTVNKTL